MSAVGLKTLDGNLFRVNQNIEPAH